MTYRYLAFLSPVLLLGACVSFGEDPPPSLLTLEAQSVVPAGATRAAPAGEAVFIELPESERKLDTQRVPVQVDDSTIAYLQDAVWVDRPSRLFHALLDETVSARTERLVLQAQDIPGRPALILSGRLVDFGYDARSGEVRVTFDAIRRHGDGNVERQRFSASEPVGAAEAGPVGAGLNRAANAVAIQVADWVGS